jgi:hypothetical protein
MSAIDQPRENDFQTHGWTRPHGPMALLERVGRELVWLFIATAFCVVEALVFLTDLPVAKFFSHRSRKN